MVIGLLALTSIPTVTGVAEGVAEQRKANERKKDEKRMEKFYMDVFCEGNSGKAKDLKGKRIVLRDNKVYVDSPNPAQRSPPSYTAQAFYIEYPDDNKKRGLGLVSMVSSNPPMLNWIYVDKNTLELKYGNRSQSIEHIVGPWDWTEDQSGVLLQGVEGFMAAEEEKGVWAVYFDKNEDGLKGVRKGGHAAVEISLDRVLRGEQGGQ